jgi:hypothetical protein
MVSMQMHEVMSPRDVNCWKKRPCCCFIMLDRLYSSLINKYLNGEERAAM